MDKVKAFSLVENFIPRAIACISISGVWGKDELRLKETPNKFIARKQKCNLEEMVLKKKLFKKNKSTIDK